MNEICELDKASICASFAAAVDSYEGNSTLQKNIANAMLEKFEIDLISGTVLDLGCGTGFLTGKLLQQLKTPEMIALDIALPMLRKTRKDWGIEDRLKFVCADAEHLPLRTNSVDRVYSNLALQWCWNLGMAFTDIRRVLRAGGKLVFSTFGPQTLHELKRAWAQVDNYTHVNEFYNGDEIKQYLEHAGFQNIKMEHRLHICEYEHVIGLMRQLKGIGAHNVNRGRNRGLTGKNGLMDMYRAYDKFRVGSKVPATFEVIYVSVEAGH